MTNAQIFFAILTAIISIFAVIQTVRSLRFQRRLANAQGHFRSPSLDVHLFDRPDERHFIFAAPLGRSRIIQIPLILNIRNCGEKTSDEIEVFVRANRALFFGGADNITDLRMESQKIKEFEVIAVNSSEHLTTLAITAKSLHPGQGFAFQLPLSLVVPTIFFTDHKVATSDGRLVEFKSLLDSAYHFDCAVMQRNQGPVSNRFSISLINIADGTAKQFFDAYNIAAKNARMSAREGKGMASRILISARERLNAMRRPVRDCLLFDLSHDFEAIDTVPGPRIIEVNKASVVDGCKIDDQYFFPGISVYPV